MAAEKGTEEYTQLMERLRRTNYAHQVEEEVAPVSPLKKTVTNLASDLNLAKVASTKEEVDLAI